MLSVCVLPAVNVPVQVTGVLFFDFLHGQTGVAPNGIELHPILQITFLSDDGEPTDVADPYNWDGLELALGAM